MKTKAVTGVLLTMLLLVVVSSMGVSVRVADFDSKSEDFMAQSGVDWWPMFHHDQSRARAQEKASESSTQFE